jgi:hypothetical protein
MTRAQALAVTLLLLLLAAGLTLWQRLPSGTP